MGSPNLKAVFTDRDAWAFLMARPQLVRRGLARHLRATVAESRRMTPMGLAQSLGLLSHGKGLEAFRKQHEGLVAWKDRFLLRGGVESGQPPVLSLGDLAQVLALHPKLEEGLRDAMTIVR